ncbi:MAG: cbb3-type cytochrome c oxidase subunit 3 [Rhodospirillales bacterium]|nr:cbb3-type cytochrome c oxidase subunit 3 [Rhodospirillales bacterium]
MSILAIIHVLRDYSVLIVGVGFLAVVVGAYWPGRRERMERHGMIPLEDDR